MTADIEYIAKGLSPKARPYKNGWITCCPAHDDNSPSLAITPGDSEAFTVHCFAGCDWKAVKAAIKARGLYEWQPGDSAENYTRGRRKDDFIDKIKEALRERQTHIRTVPEFMPYAAALPPPAQVCGPFQTHSSGFIAAPGGSGKSMWSLGLAAALARGEPFSGWSTPGPCRVHLVDVEMSDPGLYQRLRTLGMVAERNITLDTSDQRDKIGLPRFQLGPAEHMQGLMADASQADVIIIDNVSACLTPERTGDLFSPETWQQVFPLEQWARQRGKLLIFVDHTNKGGQLAGSLHKHRMADFVCLLERTSLLGEPWLEFLFWMDKCRYDANPEDMMPRLVRLEAGRWSTSDPSEQDDDIYLKVIEGKMTKVQAAEELGVTRKTLDNRLKKAQLRLRRRQRERNSV